MIPHMIRSANNIGKAVRYSFCSRQLTPEALKYDSLAKAKLLEDAVYERVNISAGNYKFEYFHTFGSNDLVNEQTGHLVTSRTQSSTIHVQTHRHVGISLYETLQDVQSGKWIKFTQNGNQLVSESEATWLQILGVGSHYVLQYFNPADPTSSFQVGVNNGAIGTELKLEASKTELFKLIPS